ncbi:MAG: hypothetical protein IKG93_04810 [Clostridiales bacterium]|nr:hypothetical protein [Clostridiales bacterium]
MKLHGWKQKCIALLLAGSMMYCGCHKAITKDEETTTSKEPSSQTEVLLESESESSTEESSGTESESTSEKSSETKETRELDLQIPEDAILRDIKENLLSKKKSSTEEVLLGSNGRYRINNLSTSADSLLLLDLYVEFLFSEEGYEFAKSSGDDSGSLDEYREKFKQLVPQYSQILDDDYHLKQMPVERMIIAFTSVFDPSMIEEDTLQKCISEGFKFMITDPQIRSDVEKTLTSDRITGDCIYMLTIALAMNSDFDVEIHIMPMNYRQEMKEFKTVVKYGKKIDNKINGVAKISVRNAFSDKYSAKNLMVEKDKKEAEDLLAKLEQLREDSDTQTSDISTNGSPLLRVSFDDVLRSEYKYYGKGKWTYTSGFMGTTSMFSYDDPEKYMNIIEEIVTSACLSRIQTYKMYEAFEPDFSNPYDQSKLAKEYPNGTYQVVEFYVKDDSFWMYEIIRQNDELIYYEGLTINHVLADGQDYPEHADEYEYGGVKGEMYFRPTMEDVFYEANGFDGHGSLDFLLKETPDTYTFLYGIPVKCGSSDFYCEVFESGAMRETILLDPDGYPFAGWKWSEEKIILGANDNEAICGAGLALMQGIITRDMDPDIEEYLDHARTHIGVPGQDPKSVNQTAADWIKADQKEQGLPDLTAEIKKESKEYSDSPVVKEYMDYFASRKEYKLETWTFGNFRFEHEIVTADNMDFYHISNVHSHDNSFDYDFLYIALGDYVYQGNPEKPRKYPKDSYFTREEVDLQLPEPLTPSNSHKKEFITAYDATIDGDSYIVEEWKLDGEKITYFCKDGRIAGFSFKDLGHKMVCHIVDFSKTADDSLLREPTS